MKRLYSLFFICFFFISMQGFSDDLEANLFETYEGSVVYVSQSFFIDESKTKCPDIYKRVEKHYDIEILNKYISLGNGTGFIVTKSGYILTNNHVIKITDEIELKNAVIRMMTDELFAKMPISEMGNEEYKTVREDLRRLITNSTVVYQVRVNNKTDYTAKLIDSNEDKDIALLKIDGENFQSAPIGNSDSIKTGNQVIAVGYPLQSAISLFSKDFKSTMTSGLVSAIRPNDNEGIQHTASINPGNSGGPLFSKSGEIVGINTALLRNANNIYFSIPAATVVLWLNSSGHSDIISANKNDSIRTVDGIPEIGDTVAVDLKSGYSVFVNGTFRGKTPLSLDGLRSGENTIKIESDSEICQQRYIVNPGIRVKRSLVPLLKKITQKLRVTSTVSGADVFIDNKLLGKTPFEVNEISAGKHTIEISLKDHIPVKKEIVITKTPPEEFKAVLEKAYIMTFSMIIPNGSEITVSNDKVVNKYSEKDIVYIKPGLWSLSVKNKFYNDFAIKVVAGESDLKIDLKLDPKRSAILFKNLKKGSKIFIDDKNVTKSVVDGRIETSAGEHSVKIVTQKFSDISTIIVAEPDKDYELTIIYSEVSLKDTGFRAAAAKLPLLAYSI